MFQNYVIEQFDIIAARKSPLPKSTELLCWFKSFRLECDVEQGIQGTIMMENLWLQCQQIHCTFTASSAALQAAIVASMSPVWPTMSPFGRLTRTYKKSKWTNVQITVRNVFTEIRQTEALSYLVEFAAKYSIPGFLSNLQCLHLWLDIKCDSRLTRNFHIFFHFLVKIPRPISVPEESYMTKFYCLTVTERNRSD